jgi:uncharacterized protein YkwD
MRFHVLSFLLLLAACFDAAASDLYTAIDRLRAGGGNCAAAENLPRLKPNAALERVARDLARGDKLDQSLKAAGYRETRASAFSFTGDGVGAQAAEILARQTYCQRLQDAGLTEVGVYLEARQVWIVMAAPFAPSVGLSGQAAGQRVLDLVNQARATRRYCGNREFESARPVRWNDALAESSQRHSEDMARNNYLNHIGSDGSTAEQRVQRAGYRYRATGENIAGGQLNPEDAVASWIGSPEHCANLMNPAFTEMGAGFAVDRRSEMGVYWTQVFGAPR